MSYTPTTWQTGDTITAEKLNNMESGISANAGYWIPVEQSGGVLSVPANKVEEVCNALYNPERVFVRGVCSSGQVYYPGYCVNDGAYECRITKETMVEIGYSSAGKMVISPRYGGGVDVEIVPDIFIVTLTPTAQDYSGTMDKTPSDIETARVNDMRIMFSIPSLGASVEATQFIGLSVACANITYDISGQDVLIQIVTSASDATYSTKIFPLTHMS